MAVPIDLLKYLSGATSIVNQKIITRLGITYLNDLSYRAPKADTEVEVTFFKSTAH